jgi:hypothetical protein
MVVGTIALEWLHLSQFAARVSPPFSESPDEEAARYLRYHHGQHRDDEL